MVSGWREICKLKKKSYFLIIIKISLIFKMFFQSDPLFESFTLCIFFSFLAPFLLRFVKRKFSDEIAAGQQTCHSWMTAKGQGFPCFGSLMFSLRFWKPIRNVLLGEPLLPPAALPEAGGHYGLYPSGLGSMFHFYITFRLEIPF